MARVISLVLEASTYHGSVALLDGVSVAGSRAIAMRGRDAEALMPAVAELLLEAGHPVGAVERIICGAGPGSFTSLRIAASIAKGIALVSGASLVPLSSLALLVASRESRSSGRYLAAVDAMRGEQYIQPFDVDDAGVIRPAGALRLVPAAAVDGIARDIGATPIGPSRSGSEFVIPNASSAALITNLIEASESADLGAWEPAYGRLAEAQVKWEAESGRPLAAG